MELDHFIFFAMVTDTDLIRDMVVVPCLPICGDTLFAYDIKILSYRQFYSFIFGYILDIACSDKARSLTLIFFVDSHSSFWQRNTKVVLFTVFEFDDLVKVQFLFSKIGKANRLLVGGIFLIRDRIFLDERDLFFLFVFDGFFKWYLVDVISREGFILDISVILRHSHCSFCIDSA